MTRWFWVLIVVPLALGCSPEGDDGSTIPEVKLSELKEGFFQTSCSLSASCHKGPNGAQQLSLDGDVHADIVNVESSQVPGMMLVVPGDLEASYLWEKVAGEKAAVGTLMPPANGLGDDPRIEDLKNWILNGAKDD